MSNGNSKNILVVFTNCNGNPVDVETGEIFLNNKKKSELKYNFDTWQHVRDTIRDFLTNYPQHEAIVYSNEFDQGFRQILGVDDLDRDLNF